MSAVKKWSSVFLFLTGAVSVAAQSAEEVERLSAESSVRWVDTCVWVYAAHGEPYSEHDAFFYSVQFKAVPKNAAADDKADLAGLALVLMRVWKFKGGLFYSIFKNRRYAFREMIYLGIFDPEDDPSNSFSGEKLLRVLSRISALK